MNSPSDKAVADGLTSIRVATDDALCPVDRLPRRQRNKLCIRIILVGLVNFLAYTLGYAALGGDAHNGGVVKRPDGTLAYVVRGHFIRDLSGREREVSRRLWIYSYVHSISVPITSAALVISMLVLARPHIIATMRDGWIKGPTFIASFSTIVIVGTLFVVGLFIWEFVQQLARAG